MINNGLFTSRSSEWSTPQDFFDKLAVIYDRYMTDEPRRCWIEAV